MIVLSGQGSISIKVNILDFIPSPMSTTKGSEKVCTMIIFVFL